MSSIVSLGMVRGILTAVLFGAFMTLWLWAWSSKRRADFAAMAAMPLEADMDDVSRGDAR
jgi:cytochrome c oxidase cbb3-type subunit 4